MKKLIILAVMVALVSCSHNVVVKPDRPDFINKVGEVWIENDKIFSVGVGKSQNTSIATTKARMRALTYISTHFSKQVEQGGRAKITKSSLTVYGSHIVKRHIEKDNGVFVVYALVEDKVYSN